jgi:hypothetical protein
MGVTEIITLSSTEELASVEQGARLGDTGSPFQPHLSWNRPSTLTTLLSCHFLSEVHQVSLRSLTRLCVPRAWWATDCQAWLERGRAAQRHMAWREGLPPLTDLQCPLLGASQRASGICCR